MENSFYKSDVVFVDGTFTGLGNRYAMVVELCSSGCLVGFFNGKMPRMIVPTKFLSKNETTTNIMSAIAENDIIKFEKLITENETYL